MSTDKAFGKSMKKGFLWLFGSSFGQYLLQFATLIILARLLTPEEFGVVGAALIVLNFTTILSEIGVGPAIVQKANLEKSTVSTANSLTLFLGFSFSFLLAMFASDITNFFDFPELKAVLYVFTAIVFLGSLSVTGLSLLQRSMRFKELALLTLLSYAFGYMLFAIPLAFLGFGIWSLVFGYLAQYLIKWVYLLITMPECRKFSYKISEAKHLLNYGLGMTLAKFANYIAGQGDNIVVGRNLGAADLGVYGKAYQLMVLPASLFGSVLDKVLFPVLSALQSDDARAAKLFYVGSALIFMVSIPLSCLLIILANEIVLLILGPTWIAAVEPFAVLASILVFRMGYKISDSLVRAKGAVYRRAWRQTIYAVLVIGLSLIGLKFWGLLGVAIGVAFAIIINYVLMLQLSITLVKLNVNSILISLIKNIVIVIAPSFLGFWLLHNVVHNSHLLTKITFVTITFSGSYFLLISIFRHYFTSEFSFLFKRYS